MQSERMSVIQLLEMFPDDAAAERLFVKMRWPDGIRCPYCESDNICEETTHKTIPFRCNN